MKLLIIHFRKLKLLAGFIGGLRKLEGHVCKNIKIHGLCRDPCPAEKHSTMHAAAAMPTERKKHTKLLLISGSPLTQSDENASSMLASVLFLFQLQIACNGIGRGLKLHGLIDQLGLCRNPVLRRK